MKKLILVAFLVSSALGLLADKGYKVSYFSESSKYILSLDVSDYSINTKEISGQTFTQVDFENSVSTNKKGYAALPLVSKAIMISADKNVDIQIEAVEFKEYHLDFPLIPSRGVIYRNEDPATIPYVIDEKSVTDLWYPSETASISEPFILKDARGITVKFSPFQYNAEKQILRVYSKVKVVMSDNSTEVINPLMTSGGNRLKEVENIYSSLFLNYEANRDALTYGQYGDILVITTERDEDAIAPYIQWKKEKGFNVSKEVVDAGTNVASLIQEKYDANNDLFYVVLVGDYDDIKSNIGTSQNAPMDPVMGCVVGTDDYADIVIGRFSAATPEEVTIQVNKAINYEKTPEDGAAWYSTALGIGSDEGAGSGDDGEADFQHMQNIWDNKLDPFTYETYHTAYDPGANASMVADAVNSGTGIINYVGHGSDNSWVTSSFNSTDVDNLTNGNKTPIIFSVACVNGAFHSGNCFAEHWLNKENGGAVAMLAATINQPWTPPMRGQDYFNDLIKGGYNYDDYASQSGINSEEQRTLLGSVVINGFAFMLTETAGSDDLETVQTWTIFGDPAVQIRTESPKAITLSNDGVMVGIPFNTNITSPSGPVANAMVCLSQNDTYFSGMTNEDGAISLEQGLNPGTAKLVVTSFNGQTIYMDIEVGAADGPWISLDNASFNDASSNGLCEFGEDIQINTTAINNGVETSNNVVGTLSSEDIYLTITDNTHNYGNIAAGSNAEGLNAFAITLANNVPDQHNIICLITFTDDANNTWTSNLQITANAPVLATNILTIDDSETGNNNGILDPGETVKILVPVTNNGHSNTLSTNSSISTVNNELTINDNEFDLEIINTGTTTTAEYSLTAGDDVEIGTPAQISFIAITGEYSFENTFDVVIGEIPVYVMNTEVVTTCNGLFLDSGGADEGYGADESYVLTFTPGSEDHFVKVTFNSFNIENGYDKLWVYDGTSLTANEIEGSPFTGTTIPEIILATNDEGALTFRFESDNIINEQGWNADVSCESTVEIDQVQQNDQVSIYPNPASNDVSIANVAEATIKIYTLNGTLLFSRENKDAVATFNVSHLEVGLYLVQIIKTGKTITQKLIISQ